VGAPSPITKGDFYSIADRQRIHCVQRPHRGPIPIATAPDVLLVERFEDPRDGPLPQLVFPGGYPERAAVPVAFRDIVPLDAFGAVALPLQSLDQVVNVLRAMLLVRLRADVIDARRRILADVAPALAALRLLEQLVAVARPGRRLLLGLLRSPLQAG
jgi:hypothetical protein